VIISEFFIYAIEGVASFSTKPLKIAFVTGIGISTISLLYVVYIFFRTLMLGKDIPGYASIICIMTFLVCMQLIAMGILGGVGCKNLYRNKEKI